MSYFPVDDQAAFHPKFVAAGNASIGLWTRAGSWCKANVSGGCVPPEVAALLGTKREARKARRGRLGVSPKTARSSSTTGSTRTFPARRHAPKPHPPPPALSRRGPHGRAANTPSRRRARGTLRDVEPEQPAFDTRTLETRRPPTQRGRQHGVCAAAKDAHTRVSDSSPEAHLRPRRTHQAKTLAGSRADYPRPHDGIGACKTPVPNTMLRDYRRRSVTCVSSSSSKRHVIRSASAEPPIVRNT
jgi:hypothetical protein